MTAICITMIICVTVILLCLLSRGQGGRRDE